MRSPLDRLMLALAGVAALAAVLLVVRPSFVVDLWTLPDTTELTFLFLASIMAAAAASTAWAALRGERASYVGIALDMLVIFTPLTAFLLLLDPARGGGASALVAVSLLVVGVGVWLLATTVRSPFHDPRATPRPVLAAFAFFAIALVGVGGALVLGVPDVLPWRLSRELSMLCGLIFLGAATYFAYGLARPRWTNAGGQLAGFLAYDLVLILPFLARLPTVPDQWRVSQLLYIVVLVASGVLAAWYLFLDPVTRFGRRPG